MSSAEVVARIVKGTVESGAAVATSQGPSTAARRPAARDAAVRRRSSSPLRRAASRATAQVRGAMQGAQEQAAELARLVASAGDHHGHRGDEAGQRQPQVECRTRQRQRRAGIAPQDIGGQAVAR